MKFRLPLAFAPLLALAASLQAQNQVARPQVSEQTLRRHIEVLASDAFEGRQPGTEGEKKTLAYLSREMAAAGLGPGGEGGGWFQPVRLVSPRPAGHRARFEVNGRAVPFAQPDIVLVGSRASERIAGAPVWLVGAAGPEQLAGADLRGAVALLTFSAELSRDYDARAAALRRAGAVAAILVIGEDTPWSSIRDAFRTGRDRLVREDKPSVEGAMPYAAAAALVDRAQLAAASGANFRAVPLRVRASLEVSTDLRGYTSYNVIGRLRGSGGGRESLLYLAHWDHLGRCAPEGAADRICNGAVDNASGLAVMLEAARQLAKGPRPVRDILFMGTTAEELGLLGAEHFTRRPTVPLRSIVAAINIDTAAIAPRGMPSTIVGRGRTPLDPLIDATVRALGRAVDTDLESHSFLERQDGWALLRVGVPAVMVGGAFSDMAQLGRYTAGPYHRPEDDLSRSIELGGAAEDTELIVALGRKLADPAAYPAPAR